MKRGTPGEQSLSQHSLRHKQEVHHQAIGISNKCKTESENTYIIISGVDMLQVTFSRFSLNLSECSNKESTSNTTNELIFLCAVEFSYRL